MTSSRSIRRVQNYSQKLHLALTKVQSRSSERGDKITSHIALLPSAMEEEDLHTDHTRRSRAPSPEGVSSQELYFLQHNNLHVSFPYRFFLRHGLTIYQRKAIKSRNEPRGRVPSYLKMQKTPFSICVAFMNKKIC